MSDSEGALDAVAPVAAHMPGGGFTSISLPVAVRILFETVDAFVELLLRDVAEGVSVVAGSGSRMPSGCGNGTGVAILLFEEAMIAVSVRRNCLLYRICVVFLTGTAQCVSQGGRLVGRLAMARCLGDNLAFA